MEQCESSEPRAEQEKKNANVNTKVKLAISRESIRKQPKMVQIHYSKLNLINQKSQVASQHNSSNSTNDNKIRK